MILLLFLDQASKLVKYTARKAKNSPTCSRTCIRKTLKAERDGRFLHGTEKLARRDGSLPKIGGIGPVKIYPVSANGPTGHTRGGLRHAEKRAEATEELFPMQPEVFLYKGIYLSQTGKPPTPKKPYTTAWNS